MNSSYPSKRNRATHRCIAAMVGTIPLRVRYRTLLLQQQIGVTAASYSMELCVDQLHDVASSNATQRRQSGAFSQPLPRPAPLTALASRSQSTTTVVISHLSASTAQPALQEVSSLSRETLSRIGEGCTAAQRREFVAALCEGSKHVVHV